VTPASVRRQPYYCEENIWWLAQDDSLPAQREVLVITNARRQVIMQHQRARPIAWDYHVVLLTEGRDLWDLEHDLGMPVPLVSWIDASFPRAAPAIYRPRFRIVAAEEYVRELRSDRSHMRDAHGRWSAPPPPWPCIGEGEPNLERFIDLDDPFLGVIASLDELRARIR
jgi:hypothetical protein